MAVARALVIVAVAMAAILVATAWLGYRSAQDASRLVARGQAESLLDQVRRSLHELGRPPSDDELAALVAELADRGVRHLDFVEESAGPGTPPFVMSEHADRIRVVAMLPPRPGPRRGPPPALVLDFESTAAGDVAAAATRSLITACAGGLLLIVAALAAARWMTARARERHLAALGAMSAVLAHELRNPLASLKGNAQLLAESLDGAPRERADVVVAEAVRLERLAGGLLDFVRTGALVRAEVDPAALARDAAAEVGGARVEVDAAAAPARWSLDGDRFRQVLVNVLRNAIEASPADATVQARVWEERGALRVSVRDAGPGIAAGQEQVVFEPFHTGKVRGTGLGLAVARRIVELHGGTIRAGRAEGGGAVIDMTVPG